MLHPECPSVPACSPVYAATVLVDAYGRGLVNGPCGPVLDRAVGAQYTSVRSFVPRHYYRPGIKEVMLMRDMCRGITAEVTA
jgi:hypothetical protein